MVRARDFVDASLYQTEEDVVQDALRHLLRARPHLRIRLAVHRYETEGLSVEKAASLAGVSWAQMKDILVEPHVQLRLGAETTDEVEQEVQTLRTYFQDPE
jgi:predicted HTH domain antitoxin